jgi:membrane fusion protein (multidrug efflux system)
MSEPRALSVNDVAVPEAAPATPATTGRKAVTANRPRTIALAVLAVAAVTGASYWAYERQFQETDDAQIDAEITNVSPRVAGTIKSVKVVENQRVKAGDLLAEIDDADLRVAVDAAKAQVTMAEAELKAEDPTVGMTETSNKSSLAMTASDLASAQAALSASRKEVQQLEAQLAQARATDRTVQTDKARADQLIKQGAIAQAELDERTNAAKASSHALTALEQALAAARDHVREQEARITASKSKLAEVQSNAPRQLETRKASVLVRQAQLEAARAQLAQAELNLGYARIVAPVAGIVGKKAVSVGDHVALGQELLGISQIEDVWVTANFRETQLREMHPGQLATVHVDALDVDLRGKVESMGGATGSRFSVLPPENASGNYVKVVQRVPVRIALEPGQPGMERLRPGMSVEPKVTLR